MKLVKIVLNNPTPVTKVMELDKALREKFSSSCRPPIMVYCMISNGNSTAQFMVNEFAICSDGNVFHGLPTLAMGFIMGATLSWDKPVTQDMMTYASSLQ